MSSISSVDRMTLYCFDIFFPVGTLTFNSGKTHHSTIAGALPYKDLSYHGVKFAARVSKPAVLRDLMYCGLFSLFQHKCSNVV
jgi:hypothetical protein